MLGGQGRRTFLLLWKVLLSSDIFKTQRKPLWLEGDAEESDKKEV